MAQDGFKSELFTQFARIGKALSSPARLELLDLLNRGEKSVEALAGETGISVANASQHLQQLKAARLVDTRKEGHRVYYSFSSPAVLSLLRALQQVGEERLLEVRELVEIYINSRDSLEPVPLEKLRERVAKGEVIVLDVRPEEEYRAGHLPEAHSIPVEQLEERIHELPAGKEVIAYCRGPYCLLSVSAVEQLRKKGFKAVRLEEGFPEWKSQNLPYETTRGPST